MNIECGQTSCLEQCESSEPLCGRVHAKAVLSKRMSPDQIRRSLFCVLFAATLASCNAPSVSTKSNSEVKSNLLVIHFATKIKSLGDHRYLVGVKDLSGTDDMTSVDGFSEIQIPINTWRGRNSILTLFLNRKFDKPGDQKWRVEIDEFGSVKYSPVAWSMIGD